MLLLQHIEGWVGRLMAWRSRKLQTETMLNLRWTILPPQFYENLLDSVTKNVAMYGNGKLNPFPSFIEVDYVFFPLPLENREWVLLRLELVTQELVIYACEDICVGEKYRNVIHPRLTKIAVYFGALLVHLRYWKKTGKPEKCMTFELNEEYMVSNSSLSGNEGVYLCMLMEHLVADKPIIRSGQTIQNFLAYRRFMADKLYFWRCLPRPNLV
ncbi:putative papain-like cysteine peptidase superfamily [Helianthus anomalus]